MALAVVVAGACAPALGPARTAAGAESPDARTDALRARLDRSALRSWRASASRAAIVGFVASAVTEGSDGYVPPDERLAVLDNDGTLWREQPTLVELQFAIDRVHVLAPEHPEWRAREPFRSVLQGDIEGALRRGGRHAVGELVAATHAGMTTDEFESQVRDWIATARDPHTDRRYSELVYQPMLELLDLLRAHGFTTYIVSGGDTDFIRAFAAELYGVPPERVVGSTVATRWDERGGEPVLVREPRLVHLDDGPGKPIAIERAIGRRPRVAFGNSDGDLEMLEWTAAAPGPSLVGLVHHTDAGREYAYDRDAKVGRLSVALDEARARGWLVVDMRRDWAAVHPGGT